ncbi:MAG: hypothetical protein LBJ00_07610 [Planctomycetaceae bacterium]|nr:hypothetical protein [Planctomycetaceae bacterium]
MKPTETHCRYRYTVAGKAIGFAPEQPLHVVALACPASGILKQLEYINLRKLPKQ